MRYKESKALSAELLRRVVALMGQHDAAFHPVSFTVWYEHAAGTNARLTQALETAMKSEPRLGDETIMRMYQEFVSEIDQAAMQRITGELQTMMTGMADSASRTGRQAGNYSEQLMGLSAALRSDDVAAITSNVASTLADTALMAASAKVLVEQVMASRREIERLQTDLVRARDEAVLDPLTRVLNRKGFDAQLAALLEQAPAPDSVHCLIMLDIDHFKKVNDSLGHVMGDRVIQALGEVLRSCVTAKTHSAARYGGEEFAVLMPHSTLAQSMRMAETVRERTKAMKIRDRRTKEVMLTVSISGGVAAMKPGDEPHDFIARADAALYQSKQAGRDRVTCAA